MAADKHPMDPGDLPKVSRAQVDLYKTFTDYDLKRESRAIVHTFVRRLPFIVGLIVAAFAIDDLAGKDTRVALWAWLEGIELSIKVSWALTSALSIFAAGQHMVFRRQIKRLGEEKRELEQQIDPGRTTSGLRADGRTQPEDG